MRNILQRFTLQLTADLIGKATGRHIPLAEAESWTIEEYINVHYQANPHWPTSEARLSYVILSSDSPANPAGGLNIGNLAHVWGPGTPGFKSSKIAGVIP
jgi:hypothetical protein